MEHKEVIDQLTAKLEIATNALQYYSNQDHWIGYHRDCTNILDDDVKAKASDDFDIIIGGRRSIEALDKIKELG
jgi:hypothetical protein